MKNLNFFIAVIILLVISVVIFNSYSSKGGAVTQIKMSDFPLQVGEWRGEDATLLERDYQILETRNLIAREYKNLKGDSLSLYIIYSEENRKALHPPEVCYTGGGASTILQKTVVPITGNLKANMFAIENRDSRQLVVYWFKAAELNTPSYMKQQIKFVLDRTFGRHSSGAMIRISTDIAAGGEEAALNKIKSFCALILPLLEKYVP